MKATLLKVILLYHINSLCSESSIKGLSDHNAFEGRHSSVGERSLLGVFRDVSIAISSKQVGAIAPFDMMYSGISSVLKTLFKVQFK